MFPNQLDEIMNNSETIGSLYAKLTDFLCEYPEANTLPIVKESEWNEFDPIKVELTGMKMSGEPLSDGYDESIPANSLEEIEFMRIKI